MKTLWLSSLTSSHDQIQRVMSLMKDYGVELKGHFWEDDIEKMAWIGPREELVKPDTSLWLILASQKELAVPSIRYGLSMLALTVQAKKGISFPIVLLGIEAEPLKTETLPTPLKGGSLLSFDDPSLAAKLVAAVHASAGNIPVEYRLDVYADPRIGQWFEVGPQGAAWSGALFGVSGAEITFHGVGPQGSLPSQSVLNYPVKGLKVSFGQMDYGAWAVQNEIDSHTSYFIQVKGCPGSIMFGPFSKEQNAEVYVVAMQ